MTERAQALEAAREWQAIEYGDRPETWAALDYYRERGWPVDVNTFPERERVADRIRAFKAGYREALAVQPPPPVGSPTRAVKLGVVEFHPQHDLRERFYAVVDDLRASGSIVDLWLMDIAAVLKEFDYDMQITTRKPKP